MGPSTRSQNKVISSSLFSLPDSSSLHPHLNGQIKTWHPEINWKKRDQRCLCELARNTILRWEFHFWYVLLNIIGWEVLCNIFFILQLLQLYFIHILRHMQKMNKSRQKSITVLLLDASYTLGSNLLLQVAPYKPSVPSHVSQIKKTKALRLVIQCFLSLLCTESTAASDDRIKRKKKNTLKMFAPQNKADTTLCMVNTLHK